MVVVVGRHHPRSKGTTNLNRQEVEKGGRSDLQAVARVHQVFPLPSHQVHQLFVHDSHQLLLGSDSSRHRDTKRRLLHPAHELSHYRQAHLRPKSTTPLLSSPSSPFLSLSPSLSLFSPPTPPLFFTFLPLFSTLRFHLFPSISPPTRPIPTSFPRRPSAPFLLSSPFSSSSPSSTLPSSAHPPDLLIHLFHPVVLLPLSFPLPPPRLHHPPHLPLPNICIKERTLSIQHARTNE